MPRSLQFVLASLAGCVLFTPARLLAQTSADSASPITPDNSYNHSSTAPDNAGLIHLDMHNTEIHDAVRYFADLKHLRIDVQAYVSGHVTLSADVDVTVDEALDLFNARLLSSGLLLHSLGEDKNGSPLFQVSEADSDGEKCEKRLDAGISAIFVIGSHSGIDQMLVMTEECGKPLLHGIIHVVKVQQNERRVERGEAIVASRQYVSCFAATVHGKSTHPIGNHEGAH